MNRSNRSKKYSVLIRVLFSVIVGLVGALLVTLKPSPPAHRLFSDVGLALIVAGIVSAFHEAVIKRIEGDEAAREISEHVHRKLRDFQFTTSGIRLVSPVRKDFEGYYEWAVGANPEQMFLAGRSVLHRVDHDLRKRSLGAAEVMLARRLHEGSTIRIMFLDPRSNLIPRLAQEEQQTTETMLSHLATSIGVSLRLYNKLKGVEFPNRAQLDICLYDEVPYFAYHAVGDQVLVGFYFASALGDASGVYELVDVPTRKFFEGHFHPMLWRARAAQKLLVALERGVPTLNQQLLSNIRLFLETQLPKEQVEQLFS